MTHLGSQPASHEEAERLEFESELDASADKLFHALERARGEMTPQQRERAERNSEAILKRATGNAKPSQRRA